MTKSGQQRDLRWSMEQRFDGVDHWFDAIDRRFEAVERRFDGMERRFDGLDRKVDGVRVELDAKLSRGFTWLVGIQIAVLIAVIGALFDR